MFITKCCNKKTIKKNPDSAINNFLPIEEVDIPLLIILNSIKLLFCKFSAPNSNKQ